MAFALFDKGADWNGPFYEAGFRDPVIEPILDNDTNPDMLAVTDSHFALLEVSCSPNKDFAGVRNYERGQLTSALKTRVGDRSRARAGAPFFVTTESGIKSFPPDLNAIRVASPVEVYLPRVDDNNLREHLENWNGFPKPVSNYSLLGLPESDIDEIKLPLAGILKGLSSEGGVVRANEVADYLLGDLADAVTQPAKTRLVKNVATLLERAGAALSEAVSYDKSDRSLTLKRIDTPAGRKAFSKAISIWMQVPFLESFSSDEPESEDD
ncbi:MAG: hypothetical protein ACLQAS_07420 [Thermoplasmata archaeon]